MPTVIVIEGFRISLYSEEGKESPHVHIFYQGHAAKFWINPVRLANNYDMNMSALSKAAFLVKKHEKLILEKWNEFFSRKF